MATTLSELQGKPVSIITNDGRNIVGNFRGHDHTINVILDSCHERVYSTTAAVEVVPLGLYIVRGDNIAVIGELDEAADTERDLSSLRAVPIKPLAH
ncbi:hypothetical protein JKP88DRAFT_230861 [Tribonema minus]|uniref:U6 snRNA-associated Sm-like protein LSm8 n=1 Tax=Tribonema minus TaxID=303371 RepID=A0A835ZJ72_9STRA|nr:hypothetical protein JKP88DRAFT_230861 [Tribonema minus]